MSHNQLSEIPFNLPKSLAELRIHDNKVKKIQKETFKGMTTLHVLGKFMQTDEMFWNYMQYAKIGLHHHQQCIRLVSSKINFLNLIIFN